MTVVRRQLSDPPHLEFGGKGDLAGIMPITRALKNKELHSRILKLGRCIGPHAPEDREIDLYVGMLPDGRLAVCPCEPFAGANYAIELP